MTAFNTNLKEQILQRFKRTEGTWSDFGTTEVEDGDEEPTSDISGCELEGFDSNEIEDGTEQSPLLKMDPAQAPRGENAPLQPRRRQRREEDEQDISMSEPSTNQAVPHSQRATQLELRTDGRHHGDPTAAAAAAATL